MYWLYSALFGLALIFSSPYWLLRMLRGGKYRAGLRERFGQVPDYLRPRPGKPCIWFHAVSVGEVLSISGLIERLQVLLPEYQLFISTTTLAGQKLAREKFGEQRVFYFPLDFRFAIKPFLNRLQPDLIVLAETEFWPNFLRLARAQGIQVAVVNARISDRSLPRYRKVRRLLRRMLAEVNLFLAQSEEDRGRLVEIGAPGSRVQVTGNLKFDITLAKQVPLVADLKTVLNRSTTWPVLVCGSTVQGEERMLLEAFRSVLQRFPKALLILAPRHPERWPEVLQFVKQSQLPMWQRSRWADPRQPLMGGVFVLDSIGELASVYSVATIAFVGGSLVKRGGHNILEPAQHGVAIVVGPYTENFRDIVSMFVRAGAVDVVREEDLAKEILHLLNQEEKRALLGRHASQVVRGNAGATDRTVAALEKLLNRYSAPPVNTAAESTVQK